jgi:clan AA aspartic protease
VGKVIEKIRLTNLFEPDRTVEIEALIDTGAMMLALPQDVVDKLGLRKMRETTVRYANNYSEGKSVYGVVTAEMKGRAGEFSVVAMPEGSQALVGQVLLELLDLVVDPGTRSVVPNPRSPDMPVVDMLVSAAG